MEFVWVFNHGRQGYSGGVFSKLEIAESWIAKNKLSGMLTKYPLDIGVLEWALENDYFCPPPEKLKQKMSNPSFIGTFTSASQEHYHYKEGARAS